MISDFERLREALWKIKNYREAIGAHPDFPIFAGVYKDFVKEQVNTVADLVEEKPEGLVLTKYKHDGLNPNMVKRYKTVDGEKVPVPW